ncbi:hypothetical protein BWQ96_05741 [Gracilariopsis chorda]|uniref:Uncharacterized protein n=1 Tax=Gracilariopsis chorda TaxID=448386 RepID=A0A2V3IR41_9FLOR|nr:hypothetical protein BWQ96_05741 [Gracilariopsis chorda]|eukprot:PXF44563.1 hypothetical protein BWQ96_05741 [Gracilariopsis chorda]
MHIRSVFILLALLFVLQAADADAYCWRRQRRRLVRINPPTLLDPVPFGYSQIVVDTRNAVAHVAGQNAINQTGSLVGETFAEQLEQTLRNVELALEAVEADINDILKSILITVDLDPSTAEDILAASLMNAGGPAPPGIVFSSDSLLEPGVLVEIQVDVAVPESFVRRLVCS